MFRVYTARHVAMVADEHPVRNRAAMNGIGEAMRESRDSLHRHLAIAGNIAVSRPDETPRFSNILRIRKEPNEDIGHAIAFHSEAAGSRAYGPRKMSVSLSRVK